MNSRLELHRRVAYQNLEPPKINLQTCNESNVCLETKTHVAMCNITKHICPLYILVLAPLVLVGVALKCFRSKTIVHYEVRYLFLIQSVLFIYRTVNTDNNTSLLLCPSVHPVYISGLYCVSMFDLFFYDIWVANLTFI